MSLSFMYSLQKSEESAEKMTLVTWLGTCNIAVLMIKNTRCGFNLSLFYFCLFPKDLFHCKKTSAGDYKKCTHKFIFRGSGDPCSTQAPRVILFHMIVFPGIKIKHKIILSLKYHDLICFLKQKRLVTEHILNICIRVF